MKKIYIAPQLVTETIEDADILTLSVATIADAGTFYDYDSFFGGTQA